MNIKAIEQIPVCNVLKALCDGETVFRVNVEKNVLSNLTTKSISAIKNDLNKDCYVYFTVH